MDINIFDQYDENSKRLIQSLTTAGIKRKNLFVHYNGELPDDGISPYDFFTEQKRFDKKQVALFFNQVKVPDFYAIRHVDGGSSNIEYLKRVVGKIYYRKEGYRLVDRVEWLSSMDAQTVVKKDYYNISGLHYSSTYSSSKGAYKTEYYNPKGETIIVEDLVHRSIQLFYKKKTYHFETLTQFFLYFVRVSEIDISNIYINSLSYPLFISRALDIGLKTTLFWQENLGNEVPGNMKNELVAPKTLKQIIFMKEKQLEQVDKMFPNTQIKLGYLSAIGEFKRKNQFRANAFILTNSDNIYGLRDLLSNFPEFNITVAAYTNMSTKLMHLEEEFNNITLIPSIDDERLSQELEKADIYLDINHGLKVGSILEQAYQNQMLIFSYKSVVQAGTRSLVFEDIQELCNNLSYIFTDRGHWKKLLMKMIEKDGKESTVEDYLSCLELS